MSTVSREEASAEELASAESIEHLEPSPRRAVR